MTNEAEKRLPLDGIMLGAIRYRAGEGHGQSVEDRAWLLRYIDRALPDGGLDDAVTLLREAAPRMALGDMAARDWYNRRDALYARLTEAAP